MATHVFHIIFGWRSPLVFNLTSLHSHLPNTPRALGDALTLNIPNRLFKSCPHFDKRFLFFFKYNSLRCNSFCTFSPPPARMCLDTCQPKKLRQLPSMTGPELPGRRLLSRIRSCICSASGSDASQHSTCVNSSFAVLLSEPEVLSFLSLYNKQEL